MNIIHPLLFTGLLLLVVACNRPAAPIDSAAAKPPAPAIPAAVTIEAALAEINSGAAVLLDVREQDEWDEKHLAGAVLIPKSELESDIAAAKELDKSTRIYTHCRRGARATEMAELLTEHGYDVVPLKFTFEELVEQGFELSKE